VVPGSRLVVASESEYLQTALALAHQPSLRMQHVQTIQRAVQGWDGEVGRKEAMEDLQALLLRVRYASEAK
jgi:hypothetical protein